MSAETRYWLLRTGSVAAILGSIFAGVGNGLHPITPRDDPEGVARVIADSGAWTLIHIVIVIGIILMLGGIVAVRHSIEGGLAEALARLGVHAGTIGATVGLITLILDGVAAKQLADTWAAAPGAGKAIALSVVSANETINFALAGLFNFSFAGVAFTLLGLAVALSGAYPRWLGWIGALAGLGSIGASMVQAFTGKPTVASLILTIIGPTVITVWLLVMGVLVGRKAADSRSAGSSFPDG
ncbi:MAG: DUF4386 family protein [Acidimicrobiia bacterium]